MAIKFSCKCGKHLKAPESAAGRRSRCPRCGDPVVVPSPEKTVPLPERDLDMPPDSGTRELEIPGGGGAARGDPGRSEPRREGRECPYCGEEILKVARKCKHCGEFFDARPRGKSRKRSAKVVVHTDVPPEVAKAHRTARSALLGGFLSFFCLGLGFLFGILAIYYGAKANDMLNRNGLPASGVAIAGMVLGLIGIVVNAVAVIALRSN